MGKTTIEWTNRTWNPIRGCSRISPGCVNCYAEKMAARFSDEGQAFAGLATRGPARWTGKVRLIEERLNDPLKWRTPQRVFVNSMSDLFHEAVPDEWIDRIFAVMALAPQHTFQILTKRPERMRDYLADSWRHGTIIDLWRRQVKMTANIRTVPWPVPNVHLGVSVENQQTADERIPYLLQTPAAVRFLSVEPLLGRVDLRLNEEFPSADGGTYEDARHGLHWIIVGGESGTGARPCDISNIRSIVEQCRAAGVACFVKQLGAKPFEPVRVSTLGESLHREEWPLRLKDRKGGDISEFPIDLQVREFPNALTRAEIDAKIREIGR